MIKKSFLCYRRNIRSEFTLLFEYNALGVKSDDILGQKYWRVRDNGCMHHMERSSKVLLLLLLLLLLLSLLHHAWIETTLNNCVLFRMNVNTALPPFKYYITLPFGDYVYVICLADSKIILSCLGI